MPRATSTSRKFSPAARTAIRAWPGASGPASGATCGQGARVRPSSVPRPVTSSRHGPDPGGTSPPARRGQPAAVHGAVPDRELRLARAEPGGQRPGRARLVLCPPDPGPPDPGPPDPGPPDPGPLDPGPPELCLPEAGSLPVAGRSASTRRPGFSDCAERTRPQTAAPARSVTSSPGSAGDRAPGHHHEPRPGRLVRGQPPLHQLQHARHLGPRRFRPGSAARPGGHQLGRRVVRGYRAVRLAHRDRHPLHREQGFRHVAARRPRRPGRAERERVHRQHRLRRPGRRRPATGCRRAAAAAAPAAPAARPRTATPRSRRTAAAPRPGPPGRRRPGPAPARAAPRPAAPDAGRTSPRSRRSSAGSATSAKTSSPRRQAARSPRNAGP